MGLTGTVEVEIKCTPYSKTHKVQISPPAPMVSLEDLEKALVTNREQLDKAAKDIKAMFKKDVFEQPPPWLMNYEGPTQNAIMAHLNINVLVPIINMKGGKAEFKKAETMPVEAHIAKMYMIAERDTLNDFSKEQQPFQMATLAAMLIIVMIFALIW